MKRKSIYINGMPAIIWLGLFFCAIIVKILRAEEIAYFLGLGHIYLLFAVPVFYGIYNFCITNKLKEMFKLYAISLISQLIGIALNGVLHYFLISADSETSLVIQAYLLITLICMVIIDLPAILIKMIANKVRR